ncbi:protein bunched, class 2/F/G isoform-like [Homarus americanus]|uniref:protein bunched, class 2/F/G isoform-like n=1 Tax=Homarus americanus TaxID=6706 RepID=UPI001C467C98|nr:protein bunched, class 2/F/G isoform-like [Homarus americanus]
MASNMNDHNSQLLDKCSNNVINLTTSETLRLDGDRSNLHLQAATAAAGSQAYQKKKNSSFQITSITSRLSNDGGEDSADDTEDISDIMDSSKVTDFDQETPSFSEDYSKSEEVFFGPAPIIPTSSQYGITALVQQTGSGGVMTAMLPQGVTVNVTEGGIALAKADGESDDVNHWQNRFKIVKIDSNEPFKRGRWICLDFMDSPAVSAAAGQKKDESSVVVNSVNLKEMDAGDHQPQTVVQLSVPIPQQTQTGQTQPHSIAVPAQYQVPHSSQASTPMVPSSQTNQSGVPTPHMSAAPQGTLSYPPQASTIPGQLQPPQGYAPTAQTPQGQAASVHPSPSAQTPPQAQPPMQQPLQQQPLQQPQPSQPAVQTTLQATTLPQSNLQPGSVAQPTIQPGMVPSGSISQPPQHQPVQAQSSMPQPTINAQSLPGQSVQQSVQQPGVMGQAGMPTQSLQPSVMGGMTAQGLGQSVVTHQGVPSQPTTVMSQPQVGVAQPNLPQQSVGQQSLGQTTVVPSGPPPQQLTQTLPPTTMTGSPQIQQVPTSQQIPTAQQLPVTQQISSNIVQAAVLTQAAVGATQQMSAAAQTGTVKPSTVSQVSLGSHPGTGAAPTPATTPAQAQAHHTMGAPTVQPTPSAEQQTSQPQPQPSQPQQPPTNLEGIPPGQPMDEAANATPPAAGGGQPDDNESRTDVHRSSVPYSPYDGTQIFSTIQQSYDVCTALRYRHSPYDGTQIFHGTIRSLMMVPQIFNLQYHTVYDVTQIFSTIQSAAEYFRSSVPPGPYDGTDLQYRHEVLIDVACWYTDLQYATVLMMVHALPVPPRSYDGTQLFNAIQSLPLLQLFSTIEVLMMVHETLQYHTKSLLMIFNLPTVLMMVLALQYHTVLYDGTRSSVP